MRIESVSTNDCILEPYFFLLKSIPGISPSCPSIRHLSVSSLFVGNMLLRATGSELRQDFKSIFISF